MGAISLSRSFLPPKTPKKGRLRRKMVNFQPAAGISPLPEAFYLKNTEKKTPVTQNGRGFYRTWVRQLLWHFAVSKFQLGSYYGILPTSEFATRQLLRG